MEEQMKWPKKKGKPKRNKRKKKKKQKEKEEEKQEKEKKEEECHVLRWAPEKFKLRDSKKVPLIVFGEGMFQQIRRSSKRP
ncbi:hypothetical protein BDF20DRAFT_913223 [Mycotypha africana]|uniref:uncharacterized protein n=1 Tax=Mycotypha africana TaxID=64632 RepID=UPI0022FFD2F4|nr:uncharacterized protein BDF20DRAFT_913223 [Mycotypha africana]KAI8979692.1 hypothetical protein BDF20DRAFT_913223 [Mycotypha africana]